MTSLLLVVPLAALLGVGTPPARAAVTPSPNPQIEEKCGLPITLVLDASGSIQSSNAVNKVRDAAEAFLDALSNTNSSVRVTQFASLTQQLAPSTVVDDNSLGAGGALRKAIDGYYNPRPPRPANVDLWQFSNGAFKVNNGSSSDQYTNWDASLRQAAETPATPAVPPALVVYITDGDPTAYDFDKPGDKGDHGPPPDVGFGTDSTTAQAQITLDRAVEEANSVKSQGTRMLAVGVGTALSSSASQNRLKQISGPQAVKDADLNNVDSLNDVDVALVTDFDKLAALMRSLVLQLCSPSLTIQKLAQTPGSAQYAPASGWDMTTTPTVPTGTGFRWILPNTTDAVSKTVSTDANGFAQFQWEPIPPEADSAANVAETLKPNYTAGRPGPNNDFTCALRNEDGDVRTQVGDFADPQNPTFDIDPIGQEIVTCKVYNSFNYAPAIHLEKVNNPTEVRGDLADNPNPGDPPATVTSSYTVTNPGNTPLASVHVTDDKCATVEPVPLTGANAGDTDGDSLLDPGEAWRFTCDHQVSTGTSTTRAGQVIINNATATGTPPAGDPVTDDAADDVAVFTPAISIVKQVNGGDTATIAPGNAANYTYDVTNDGNTPLANVDLQDTTPAQSPPACTPLVRGAAGNGDQILDVGETWHYTCSDNPASAVVDTAIVSAVPINPVTGNPFAGRNPPVTASDSASVLLVNPAIQLTKSASPDTVVIAPGGSAPVTYTFTATNPGDTPLNRPGAPPAGTGSSATDPGWVVDPQCDQPTTFTGGDANANQLLDPGEAWTFTCTNQVSDNAAHLVPNEAAITGQPSGADGQPLPIDPVHDVAVAVVRVLTPGIEVVKTALRDPVLDPDAPAIAGPDVPTPRQAQYTYDVSNTGTVSLALTPDPPTDDTCSPLVPATPLGDDNGNGLLDPDEVWHYTCETTLSQADANASGDVVNTVTATGIPDVDGTRFPNLPVTDSDTATVHVIKPGVSITKTASPTSVKAGRDVTYTFVVRNTGDAALSNVVPVDDKCAPLTFTGGDDNDNGLLDGTGSGTPERWTYTCSRAVPMPPPPETVDTNRATVTASDPLNNTYRDADTARVTVLQPAIHLEKSVSKSLVPAGSKVTYTFLATNVGTSPIAADDVLDKTTLRDISKPSNPVCRKPKLVAKEGGNQDNFLDRVPAETWRYTCRATITKPTVDLAVVGALGGSTVNAKIPVSHFATAQVTPFHPGIEVEKSASPTHLNGPGDVTYTYHVRNTGDVPLAGVKEGITDDTCSPVRYVSGDKDGDNLLDTPHSIFEDALDETWVFTCTTSVDHDTTNTVTVPGTPTDPSGKPLCDAPASGKAVSGRGSTCDTRDTSTATVTLGPDEIGPSLANTGAPRGSLGLLALSLLLITSGAAVLGLRRARSTTV